MNRLILSPNPIVAAHVKPTNRLAILMKDTNKLFWLIAGLFAFLSSLVIFPRQAQATTTGTAPACPDCGTTIVPYGDITLTTLFIFSIIYLILSRIGSLRVLKSSLLVFLSTALAGGPVIADIKTGLYLGIGSGMSHLKPGVENAVLTKRDKTGLVVSGFLGYELSRSLNVELTYSDLGTASLEPVGSVDYQDINISGLYHLGGFAVKGSKKAYSLYGRLGVGTIRNQSEMPIEREHNAHWLAGAGVQIPISDRFAIRAEGTHYDSDVSSLGVSLVYRLAKPEKSLLASASATPSQTATTDLSISGSMDTDQDTITAGSETSELVDNKPDEQLAAVNNKTHWLLDATAGQVSDDAEMNLAESSSQLPTNSLMATAQDSISLKLDSNDQTGDMPGGLLADSGDKTNLMLNTATGVDSVNAGTADAAEETSPLLAAAMPVKQDEVLTFPTYEPVQFDFDSNEINDYAKEQLMPLVGFAADHAGQQIILTGHTDDVGPEEYNQQLSIERAEAIRKFLLQQGIDQKMVKVLGAGEKRPIKSNRTASGRKTNRRVEIAIA